MVLRRLREEVEKYDSLGKPGYLCLALKFMPFYLTSSANYYLEDLKKNHLNGDGVLDSHKIISQLPDELKNMTIEEFFYYTNSYPSYCSVTNRYRLFIIDSWLYNLNKSSI